MTRSPLCMFPLSVERRSVRSVKVAKKAVLKKSKVVPKKAKVAKISKPLLKTSVSKEAVPRMYSRDIQHVHQLVASSSQEV